MKKIMQKIASTFVMSIVVIIISSSIVSAQISEHDKFPVINKLQPELIAYEQTKSSYTKIIIKQIKSGSEARNSRIVKELNCSSEQESIYGDTLTNESIQESCSQLAWRPVLDGFGNYWYSYINNGTNTIHLGYVNSTLDCSIVKCEDIAIDYQSDKAISRPIWSPDGRLIMFNEEVDIRLMDGIGWIIQKKDPKAFDIVDRKIGSGYYPVWSPNGKYIAFETETSNSNNADESKENSDIKIVDYYSFVEGIPKSYSMSEIDGSASSRVFKLTNRFKPSWTADSKYIVYFANLSVDPIGSNTNQSESTDWFVMADRVIGNNEKLVTLKQTGNFLFQISNFYRNSKWRGGLPQVNLLLNNTFDRPFTLTLNDGSLQKKQFDAFHIISEKTDIPTSLKKSNLLNFNNYQLETVNAVNLDAAVFEDNIRLAFVKQVRARYEFDVVDYKLPDGFNNRLVYKPKELDRGSIFLRAIAFPGWAQYYKGEKEKALIYGGLGSILVLYGINHAWNNKGDMVNFRFSTPFSLALLTGIALHSYSIYDAMQGLPVIKGFDPKIGEINLSIDAINNPRTNMIIPGVTLNIWN